MRDEIKVAVADESSGIGSEVAKIFAEMVKRMCENPEKYREFEKWQAERRNGGESA